MNKKCGLVMGIANERSIAFSIAKGLHENGARLIITYQGEIMFKRVAPLIEQYLPGSIMVQCDVSSEKDVEDLRVKVEEAFPEHLDFIVHGIAYANKDDLNNEYVHISRANFLQTLDISCYSFTYIIQKMLNNIKDGASMMALSYYGAEKVVPHYNVMGIAKAALEASIKYLAVDLGKRQIRVNAISAGPIKTLAASGISGFTYIFDWNKYNSPLRRNITGQDVANGALYLLSDLSTSVTGEVLHIDGGYHVIGMKNIDAPDITVNL